MFFSRLGPATAAHSACREGRTSVSPNLRALGMVLRSPRTASSSKSRHFNSETAFSLPISPSQSLLPGEAGCDLDTEGGASGRDPDGTCER